jgi:hypothetical protein
MESGRRVLEICAVSRNNKTTEADRITVLVISTNQARYRVGIVAA